MKKHILATLVLGALTLPAAAEGFYVIGDIGHTTLSAEGLDKTDNGLSIGGVYNLNNTFAIEAAYRDLGGLSSSYQDTYMNMDVDVKENLDFSALQLSAIAKMPLNDTFDVYGRLGMAKLKSKYKISAYVSADDSSASQSSSDSENKMVYGIGARYTLNEKAGIRFEYNKFADWEGLSISALTLGADYSF